MYDVLWFYIEQTRAIAFDHVQLAEMMCIVPSKSKPIQNSEMQTK